jgi:two-component system, OmpR family, response regulator VicR
MKKKILIVEDERLLADLYRDKIKRAGHDPHLAYSAEDGIIQFNKIKPNLVLLDMLLPRENGLFFLRAMKEQRHKTPVVVLSNYDDPATRKQAFLLGAREYFIKTSLTPQQMLDRIVKYL